jgi:hypothetical protein
MGGPSSASCSYALRPGVSFLKYAPLTVAWSERRAERELELPVHQFAAFPSFVYYPTLDTSHLDKELDSPPHPPVSRMSAPTRRNVLSQPQPPALAAPLPPQATKLTVESDADTRLRTRDISPPTLNRKGSGMKRRNSNLRAGTIGGLKKREWWILAVITVLGTCVRFYRLGWPDSVV